MAASPKEVKATGLVWLLATDPHPAPVASLEECPSSGTVEPQPAPLSAAEQGTQRECQHLGPLLASPLTSGGVVGDSAPLTEPRPSGL